MGKESEAIRMALVADITALEVALTSLYGQLHTTLTEQCAALAHFRRHLFGENV